MVKIVIMENVHWTLSIVIVIVSMDIRAFWSGLEKLLLLRLSLRQLLYVTPLQCTVTHVEGHLLVHYTHFIMVGHMSSKWHQLCVSLLVTCVPHIRMVIIYAPEPFGHRTIFLWKLFCTGSLCNILRIENTEHKTISWNATLLLLELFFAQCICFISLMVSAHHFTL